MIGSPPPNDAFAHLELSLPSIPHILGAFYVLGVMLVTEYLKVGENQIMIPALVDLLFGRRGRC